MSSYTIEFGQQKYKVTGTPMQPLATLIDQACAQMAAPVDPATCQLYVKSGKQALNAQDPIRFAGLQRNCTLVLISSMHPAFLTLLSALCCNCSVASCRSTLTDSALVRTHTETCCAVNTCCEAAPSKCPTKPSLDSLL